MDFHFSEIIDWLAWTVNVITLKHLVKILAKTAIVCCKAKVFQETLLSWTSSSTSTKQTCLAENLKLSGTDLFRSRNLIVFLFQGCKGF